jgi:AraC-like DNA-binding protein
LGYQSQSAFSAMFRRAFGESPRAFIERGSEHRLDNGGDRDDAQLNDVDGPVAPNRADAASGADR